MGAWARAWGLSLAMATIAVFPCAAGANDAPAPRERVAAGLTPHDLVAQCVRQLGSDSFAVREQATSKLVELGMVARDALAEACNDSDAEVRARARDVLGLVQESDFRDRLEAFSADFDGSHKKTLPGWEQFSGSVGAGPRARQLFVEMQRAEPELLELLVAGGKPASEALETRCKSVVQQAIQTPPEGRMSLGTIASVLFVASAKTVNVDEQVNSQLVPWLISQPIFQKSAHSGESSPLLKQLLGVWVMKDSRSTAAAENLKYAVNFELKAESIELATRVLGDRQVTVTARPLALLMLGKFGGKQHMATIEKLLEDAASCGMVQAHNPSRQVEIQVRDVALAVLLHLTGQNLREYGYLAVQSNPITLFQVGTLVFSQPGNREAALKKWTRWRAEHPDS
jgi:hypothetical protein